MKGLDLATRVERHYQRYLKTSFRFRDDELRQSFEAALDEQVLSKGPYLEGTAVFKRGATGSKVFAELQGRPPENAFVEAIRGERALYKHQEQAMRKVAAGRNIVVSTGTGSGKTEAFLYPILNELQHEQRAGQLGPGVRALILYPMNALANDQRDRLGAPPLAGEQHGGIMHELHAREAGFVFTYGQYIGQTPETERDARQLAFAGELASRQQMRKTPPHILLTNYSMLEYLLLRPTDSTLFDGDYAATWKFLVLDEAHQYRGSKGAEMAMLIRRVKQRLRESGHTGSLRCIATSASLTGGDKDRAAVARFAQDLFDEPFDAEDIVTGEFEPVQGDRRWRLNAVDYASLAAADVNDDALQALSKRLGVSDARSVQEMARSQLMADERALAFRQRVTGEAVEVSTLGSEIFPELDPDAAHNAVGDLAQALANARDATGTPLMTGRVHMFLKALERAFVSYVPKKQVTLDHKPKSAGAAFEVALCRECGQHYFVGRVLNGKLEEQVRDQTDPGFGAVFFRPAPVSKEPNDEETGETGKREVLCMACGSVGRNRPQCTCDAVHFLSVVRELSANNRPDQIKACGACGYNAAGRDPVRELIYGNDGPQSVIATALDSSLTGSQRKVLAFADGRQEAAFFAWFMEEAYRDLLSRNLIQRTVQTLQKDSPKGVSLARLAVGLRNLFQTEKAYAENLDEQALLELAYIQVFREFLTDERRNSLEGVGRLRFVLQLPKAFVVPPHLGQAPWNLTPEEASDLVITLLDTMRLDAAMELPKPRGLNLTWDQLELTQPQKAFRLDPGRNSARQPGNYTNWDGVQTGRVSYLRRLAQRTSPATSDADATGAALKTLRAIWAEVERHDAAALPADALMTSKDGRYKVLQPDWWRAVWRADSDTVYRCNQCGRVQHVAVQTVCTHRKCLGSLVPVSVGQLPINHYRQTYSETLPAFMRAEEHTAQLDYKTARDYQQQFKDGRIHLLSCSTTFEVGVDLGDLNTVFLRNVPPEAFNYAQRVGRAGRRAGALGFAVTYCRRNPHDLYHFLNPKRVMSGKSSPPVLVVGNPKIVARHMITWVLAAYFRSNPNRFESVGDFFGDFTRPDGVAKIRVFLQSHQANLEASLKKIVPHMLHTRLGLDSGAWIDQITGNAAQDSRLSLAETETASDFLGAVSLENVASNERDYSTAKWAKKRAETIERQSVLTLLSEKAIIPKYGFPVDVVELDTRVLNAATTNTVQLSRDLSLAISEFAPSSKLIADKKLWVSYGLKRVANKEWPRRDYRRCTEHGTFVEWNQGQPECPLACGCDVHIRQYVQPIFGFTTDLTKSPPKPQGRGERAFSTRPLFAGHVGAEPPVTQITNTAGQTVITMYRASPGRMVILTEGKGGNGFYVCGECGFGDIRPVVAHKAPNGRPCNGIPGSVGLGHQFETDVLLLSIESGLPKVSQTIATDWGSAFALTEGAAAVLEVPVADINATVFHTKDAHGRLLLFDAVPGGAGLVARLEQREILIAALTQARDRVAGGCGCGPDESCYSCLRNYRNQFVHAQLKRGPVFERLNSVVNSLNS